MMDFKAWVVEDFGTGTVRLQIGRPRSNGTAEWLTQNGLWQVVDEGVRLDEGFGIVLPRGSVEAIAVAIQNWQGHASHADTEAKVLREWLAVERDRVDRILGR
jgi:hypothetical protein